MSFRFVTQYFQCEILGRFVVLPRKKSLNRACYTRKDELIARDLLFIWDEKYIHDKISVMNDFYMAKFQGENDCVTALLDDLNQSKNINKGRVEQQSRVFVETIRSRKSDNTGFNALMQSYDLTSDEGLALMTLAEALLRIPDVNTANAMIQDKLSDGDWTSLFDQASSITGKLSGFSLSISQTIMDSMIGKIGMPFIRKACVEAMQMMGRTFVLGRDIEEAIKNAKKSNIIRTYFWYNL